MAIWEYIRKKKIGLQMIGVVMAAMGLLIYVCQIDDVEKAPQAVHGVMDLTQWDLVDKGTIKLDGEWEFYWGELLEPSDFLGNKKLRTDTYFSVPNKWNNYKPGDSSTGDGCATYRLNVKLQEAGKYLSIQIPDVATAYKLYINGKLLSVVGSVGQEAATSKPRYFPQIVSFYTDQQNIELVIQVSNFAHQKGGIKSSLLLGLDQSGHKWREKQMGFEMFILGIFFIMSIYHFGLYLLRTKDKAALYFGLFCLLIAIRTIVTGEILLMSIVPSLDWQLLIKIEYLSYYLSVPVFVKFIYHLYASNTSPKISNSIKSMSLVFSGVVIFMPVKNFAKTLIWYDVITLLACIYIGMMLIRAVRSKQEGAGRFIFGVFIFLGTVINDMFFAQGLLRTCEMVPVGLFIFIFFQALALSTKSSRAYAKLEKVSMELQQSNDKVIHILESIMDGFFALDNQARFTYVNREAEFLLQKSQEQLLGKVIWDEFPGSDQSLAYGQYRKVIMKKIPAHFEIFLDRLGLWLEVSAYPLQDGLSVFVRNIQERKQAEDQIRDYTEKLKEQIRLLDLDPDYTFEWNLDGIIVFWNHGAELGYQWTKDEALGKKASVLLETQFPQPLQEINDELMANGRWMGEIIQRRRDGTTVVVRSCRLLKRGVDGKPSGVLEFNKDITEQKNIEKEMARLDRLSLIGQMAASISHEVRNPMTTVRGFLQLLAKKESNVKYGEYYELMLSELDRANEILNEYLSVARGREPNFRLQSMNEICSSLKPLLEADAFKAGKDIEFDLGNIPDLVLDGGEIRQLILNLCRNGLEAMVDDGHTMRIATFLQGENVILSVCDEGVGIPKEVIGRLGTPFLTTKDKGTGLGLAVCYGIATRHKASIEVSSHLKGTTFTIKFKKSARHLA
ncbi:7TM diverse intracellular signaling domain-containing protein [Pelosinus sp. sgz500959]|uniref:7TM diverse intracellular signaling domain-containing protein n=1 Tax=Pelosinus sp. sgz500959 TaxID=3242472 RepID=UPI003670B2AF